MLKWQSFKISEIWSYDSQFEMFLKNMSMWHHFTFWEHNLAHKKYIFHSIFIKHNHTFFMHKYPKKVTNLRNFTFSYLIKDENKMHDWQKIEAVCSKIEYDTKQNNLKARIKKQKVFLSQNPFMLQKLFFFITLSVSKWKKNNFWSMKGYLKQKKIMRKFCLRRETSGFWKIQL